MVLTFLLRASLQSNQEGEFPDSSLRPCCHLHCHAQSLMVTEQYAQLKNFKFKYSLRAWY
jgi:hypothetical protein